MTEALVVFTPSGRRGQFRHGTRLLQAARDLGVDLDSVCGGRGLCGRCQVLPSFGDFPKHGIQSQPQHLSEFGAVEQAYQAQVAPLIEGRRLACSCEIRGDLVIDVPPDSQVHKQVVRKRAEVHDIEVDPAVRLHTVEVVEPSMHDPAGDRRRLEEALEFEWNLKALDFDLPVLAGLQTSLRAGDWRVTVAVHQRQQVIAIWPGFKSAAYGMAVDVGSTTVAAHLCDLASGVVKASAGLMNPQIRFGEDLMSRVSYALMNPGGEHEMTAAVRKVLNELAGQLATEAGIERSDILDVVLVGNPVMHHLFLGFNPVELGGAPFALAVDQALALRADQLDLALNPGSRVYVLPCIAGHVGADTAAVILSEGPHLREELCLTVDVGTNAEIVLGNSQRMLAASSPTGPAFEGAQISCGQRAAPGAVERVRIDSQTLEPRFKIIGCEAWSDEAEFLPAATELGITGICGSGIIEVLAEMYLSGIIDSDGVIRGELAARSDRVVPDGRTFSYLLHRSRAEGESELKITQNDVRQIQLAKAALYAGARLLMDRMQVDRLDRIRLAGAFGSHIDVKYAMVLGLIPDCDLQQVTSAGNAAGTGASIALLDHKARHEIESVVRRVEKVETAVEPRFQEHFVEAMAIPHKTHPYPELRAQLSLPPMVSATADQRTRGRRRSRSR